MSRSMRLGVKRTMDVAMSVLLGILLLPLVVLIALLVLLFLGRPILFRQQRPGIRGKIFTLVKFRTMRESQGQVEQPLSDDERLTQLGRFLRRTSLDELPELTNILRGQMSFVGPRPLLVEYLPLYSQEQRRRHDVRPGLTGLAQVSGRNALTWEEKFALDVWYVDNWSLHLDAWILWRTVFSALSGRGVSAEGQATAEPFRGN